MEYARLSLIPSWIGDLYNHGYFIFTIFKILTNYQLNNELFILK
jgi:hypothetical protein